jgi:hypothetical protein
MLTFNAQEAKPKKFQNKNQTDLCAKPCNKTYINIPQEICINTKTSFGNSNINQI